MKRWMVVIILLLAAPLSVWAQGGGAIEVDAGDSPLVITGWLGEGNGLSGSLRLTAQTDVESFIFLPSDLLLEGGDVRIDRGQVTLVGDPTLLAGVPKNFQVVVTGLQEAGTYQGQIELLIPGQARDEALVIPLTVVVKARPALDPLPGTAQLQLRLVRCSGPLDCGLARILLPDSALIDEWQLQFDNASASAVDLQDAEVALLGEQTGYQLTNEQVEFPVAAQTLPADQVIALPLSLLRQNIPPDHYTGNIYLTLDGAAQRQTIPVDLNVRVGPCWPLLVLLLGILLGRLFKYMQERGEPQAAALQAVNRLEAHVQAAAADDQKVLKPMVAALRRRVYAEQLADVEAQADAIETRLELLGQLRQVEVALKAKEQHPKAKEALDKVALARQHLALEEDGQAQALLAEVRQILVQLTSTMMGADGRPDADVAHAADVVKGLEGAADRLAKAPPVLTEAPWLARLKSILMFLTGMSERVRAEAVLWLVRPLLYGVLLVGLLAVGISSLYVDNGVAFGASPLTDYSGLILWGLSADVASRTLSNLRAGGGES